MQTCFSARKKKKELAAEKYSIQNSYGNNVYLIFRHLMSNIEVCAGQIQYMNAVFISLSSAVTYKTPFALTPLFRASPAVRCDQGGGHCHTLHRVNVKIVLRLLSSWYYLSSYNNNVSNASVWCLMLLSFTELHNNLQLMFSCLPRVHQCMEFFFTFNY